MALKNCKECGKEIGPKVKKCPHCGTDQRNWFMKHKFISFILILVILGGIGAATGGSDSGTSSVSSSSGSKSSSETTAKVGDTIKTDKFEISVSSIEPKTIVGGEIINSKPAEGGIYIAVQWKYKNITDKPIGSFSTPTIKLVDKNNVKYDSDIGASSSYATEVNIDSKIASDLNPGITVKDAEVFEVSKSSYDAGGWKLLIDGDKDVFVNIN